MAVEKQIPNLPAVIALSGVEQFELVQAGVSARASLNQVHDYFLTLLDSDLTFVMPLQRFGMTVSLSTVPTALGGTGATTLASFGLVYGNGAGPVGTVAAGQTGQVLVGNTSAAPTWQTAATGLVTSFSAGTTGLTPAVATTGVVTLDGILNPAHGGTGAASFTQGSVIFAGTAALAQDPANLFWDNTNKRLGVGTAAPASRLHILDNTSISTITHQNTGGGVSFRQQVGSYYVDRAVSPFFGIFTEQGGGGAAIRSSYFDTHIFANSDGSATQLTIGDKQVIFYGATSGSARLQAPATGGDTTITLPSSTGTLALVGDVVGKYLPITGGTLASPGNLAVVNLAGTDALFSSYVAAAYFNATGNVYQLSGVTVMAHSPTGFLSLASPVAGNVHLYLGGGADKTNYHRNDKHAFQDFAGTVSWMEIASGVATFSVPTFAPTPTPASLSNTQVATTAFVWGAIASGGGGPPSGVAGGDLAGSSYPNPTIAAGVLSDEYLSLASGGTVNGLTTFTAHARLASYQPRLMFNDTTNALNLKLWTLWEYDDGNMYLSGLADDSSLQNQFEWTRAGTFIAPYGVGIGIDPGSIPFYINVGGSNPDLIQAMQAPGLANGSFMTIRMGKTLGSNNENINLIYEQHATASMFHLVHFGDTLATGFTLTKGGAVNIGGNLTGTNATFTGAVTTGNLGIRVLTLLPETDPDEGAQTHWQTASSGARNLSIDLYQSVWRGFSYLKAGGGTLGLWDLDINGVGGWTFYTPLHLNQPMTGTSATFNSVVTVDSVVAKPLGGGAAGGYSTMNAGGPTNSGYFSFFKADNTRLGYIGYDNGNIGYTAEVGAHNFIGAINGQSVSLGGDVDGIHTALSLKNFNGGTNSIVRLLFELTALPNGYGLIEVNRTGGTPYMQYFAAPGLTGGHVFTGPVRSQTEAPGTNDTRVATTAFVTAAVAGGVPPGTVVDFAGDNAPPGWLVCQGQSVAVATYPNLFNAIQYKYGGAGANFSLPDLGGRVTAGKEQAASRLTTAGAGIDGATVGAAGGLQTHALTEAQLAGHLHAQASHLHEMGGHQHGTPNHVHAPAGGYFGYVNAGQIYGYLGGSDGNWIGIDNVNNSTGGIPGGATDTGGMTAATNTGNSAAVNTGSAGSGTAHQNTQPTMIMNKIIKT